MKSQRTVPKCGTAASVLKLALTYWWVDKVVASVASIVFSEEAKVGAICWI